MAKIGLKYPVYKTLDEQPKSGVIGKAITANISITVSDTKLFGDDAVAESEKAFQDGTIDLNTTDLSYQVQADLLGHTYDETKKSLTANVDDNAPYTGFGFMNKIKVNNKVSWRAIWLNKVMFGEPNDELNTRGDSTEFGTYGFNGSIMADDTGEWKSEQLFETEKDAKSFLNTKSGITVTEGKSTK